MGINISVVIPLLNEQDNIVLLYERLTKVLHELTERYEIVFVDDGSTDESFSLIKTLSQADKQVRYVRLSRNFGHQIALSAGIDITRGQCVVIMDGDLQDPPELISDMYKQYLLGYKAVFAHRTQRKGETWFKRISSKIFYRLLSSLADHPMPIDVSDFCM